MRDRIANVGAARYAVNPDKAIWRAVDGEAAILHADTSFYFTDSSCSAPSWRRWPSRGGAAPPARTSG